MKYSIYNSIIETKSGLNLLYSGLNDRFVIFKKDLTPFLNSDVELLKEKSESLYSMLVETDAIISKDRDEFIEIKEISEKIDEAPHECKIIVNPTMDCNFKCWYCYENHVKGSKINADILESVKLLINRSVGNESIKMLDLSFFGGEPLLEYDVVRELIDHLRSKCENREMGYNIGFTSNGYLIDDQIIEHLTMVSDSKSFQITLDGDREKQRLYIARAIYRDPSVVLLDEATSSLDANNEREIIDHLSEFSKNRTVIIIAHRLSTVKHADNIVFMDHGEVVEQGKHEQLINRKGAYYNLVRNQLDS